MVPSWVETPRDPASWIGTELMQLVLGQLLPDVTAIADTDSSNKLISVLKDLALKNKSWAAAICEFSCSGARDAHVSAGELRIIKAQSSKINLSFLHDEFKLAAGADLGDFLLEDYVPGADAEEPGNVFKGYGEACTQTRSASRRLIICSALTACLRARLSLRAPE